MNVSACSPWILLFCPICCYVPLFSVSCEYFPLMSASCSLIFMQVVRWKFHSSTLFNSEKQHISFPDLEFDIKTRSVLLKSAKWLFDKKVTNLIRESSTMDLKPYLDDLRETLGSSLNVEITTGVHMTGAVNEILIDYIFPRSQYLFIRINSKGSLGIKM